MNAARRFSASCLLAGVVVMGLGAYVMFKLDYIPFQEPPSGLYFRYAVGPVEMLFAIGLVLAVTGLAGRVAAKIADRLSAKKAAAAENGE